MVTTKEAGKLTNTTDATVRSWINKGLGKKDHKEKLKAEKVKNGARTEYRIKHSDLEAFRRKFLMVNSL